MPTLKKFVMELQVDANSDWQTDPRRYATRSEAEAEGRAYVAAGHARAWRVCNVYDGTFTESET